ncbi:unnamed protein product [Camellia sinensis]
MARIGSKEGEKRGGRSRGERGTEERKKRGGRTEEKEGERIVAARLATADRRSTAIAGSSSPPPPGPRFQPQMLGPLQSLLLPPPPPLLLLLPPLLLVLLHLHLKNEAVFEFEPFRAARKK